MMKRVFVIVLLLLLPFVFFGQNQREKVFDTVKKGDNFTVIASRNNTKIDSLVEWNPGVQSVNLTIGQPIVVGWREVVSEEVEGNNVAHGQGEERQYKMTKTVEKPNPPGKKDERFSWGTLLFGILLGAILGILLLYFFFVKKLKAEHECNERDLSQRIAELLDEKTKSHSEVLRLQLKIQTIEKEQQQLLDENVVLGEEIDRLKSIGQEVNDDRVEKAKVVSPQTSTSSIVLYADAIIDDYFVKVHETSDEDSVFVLQLNGENLAGFSVCESARQKVLANPSYLEGCEKQIIGNTMQLEIVSKGMAQKDASNGKWKVIDKLNVIIR